MRLQPIVAGITLVLLCGCETLKLGTALRYSQLEIEDIVPGEARVAIALPPSMAEGTSIAVSVSISEDEVPVTDERFELSVLNVPAERQALPSAARRANATVFALKRSDIEPAQRAMVRYAAGPSADAETWEASLSVSFEMEDPDADLAAVCAMANDRLVVWTKPSADLGYRQLTRRVRFGDLIDEIEEGACDG